MTQDEIIKKIESIPQQALLMGRSRKSWLAINSDCIAVIKALKKHFGMPDAPVQTPVKETESA